MAGFMLPSPYSPCSKVRKRQLKTGTLVCLALVFYNLEVGSSKKWANVLQEGWTSQGGWGTRSSLWTEWTPEWKDNCCFMSVGLSPSYLVTKKIFGAHQVSSNFDIFHG